MLLKKFVGKPYAGKPHVRIDEGVGRVFSILPALLYWVSRSEMMILYVIVLETHKGPPYIFHITAQYVILNSF